MDARRAVVEVLTAGIVFGTSGTTASFAPASASTASIGAARVVVGGAGMFAILPWAGGSRRGALALWRTRWGLAGGALVALYQLAFFAGVARAGVALGTLLTIGAAPVVVGLVSWLLLGERPTRAWLLSTVLCVLGLSLLVADRGVQPGFAAEGVILALAAAAAYACYTVAAKGLMRAGAPATEAMTAVFGLAGVLLVPVLLASGPAWIATPQGLVVAAWLGLATTTLAYFLFGRGLKVLPAGPAATLLLAEPLVATLLGVLVLGETVGPPGWVGGILVVAGLALQARSSGMPAGRRFRVSPS